MPGRCRPALRELIGWQNARDYWFPEIRSMGAAILVLAAALYPYVYLLARGAFREQSGAAEEVAQSLGAGAFARFWRVGLPLARPAIAAGTAIVMMEIGQRFRHGGLFRGADADHRHLFHLAGGQQRGRRGADRLRHAVR